MFVNCSACPMQLFFSSGVSILLHVIDCEKDCAIFIQLTRYKDTSRHCLQNTLFYVDNFLIVYTGLNLQESLEVFYFVVRDNRYSLSPMEFPILSNKENSGFTDGTVFVCRISPFERQFEQLLPPPFHLCCSISSRIM